MFVVRLSKFKLPQKPVESDFLWLYMLVCANKRVCTKMDEYGIAMCHCALVMMRMLFGAKVVSFGFRCYTVWSCV